MIKECKVILCNTAALVVDFDGVKVQLPYASNIKDSVYVKCENGKYYMSSVEEYKNALKDKPEKKTKKVKTTEVNIVEDVINSEDVENMADKIFE